MLVVIIDGFAEFVAIEVGEKGVAELRTGFVKRDLG